jgi:hypothetical protein
MDKIVFFSLWNNRFFESSDKYFSIINTVGIPA